MKRAGFASAMAGAIALLSSAYAMAETANTTAKKEVDGKWLTPDGNPTYNIASDSTVDWYTFSGFRRYHSECHTCHGPDGEGSTYAPRLVDSVKTMTYPEFMLIVAAGKEEIRTDKQAKMPAFGNNANVRCFIEDIFVYLKARAEGDLPRGRPAKHVDKPAAADKHEKECFG